MCQDNLLAFIYTTVKQNKTSKKSIKINKYIFEHKIYNSGMLRHIYLNKHYLKDETRLKVNTARKIV